MKKSLSKIKKKVWQEFSKYIRLRDSDSNGNCSCITCGVVKPYKEMQAGHLLDGRTNSILFDEEIVYSQCYGFICEAICIYNIFRHMRFISGHDFYGENAYGELKCKRCGYVSKGDPRYDFSNAEKGKS